MFLSILVHSVVVFFFILIKQKVCHHFEVCSPKNFLVEAEGISIVCLTNSRMNMLMEPDAEKNDLFAIDYI